MFLIDYLSLFFFLFLSICLSFVIFMLSFALTSKQDDKEKLTAYECGFNPFEDSRLEFDVKFYLVAILFIVFDLEISFLFPFIVSFDQIGFFGLNTMFLFLIVLTFGFVFEWQKGALDWS